MTDLAPPRPLVNSAGEVDYEQARRRIGTLARSLARGLDIAAHVGAAEGVARLERIAELDRWRREVLSKFWIEPQQSPPPTGQAYPPR